MDSARRLIILRDKKGFALVYVALLIVALVGFLGLAVDAGHLYVVRGQLQNAADAAALAGAWSLYKDPLNPGQPPVLDWERARTAATNFIKENKSDGAPLADGVVEVGYWPTLTPDAPLSTVSTGPNQSPAVRVTIGRSDGSNGGPVSNFFIKVLNAANDRTPVSSRPAVAVSGYPGAVPGGVLFPIALSSCMADYYFLNSHSVPPPTFKTKTPFGFVPSCETAQWTSLTTEENGKNSADLISGFITDPATRPALSSDNSIWIATGEMNSLFKDKNAGLYVGKDVLVPVVTGNTGNITKDSTNKSLPVQGFATIHIVSVKNGSDPYVEAYIVDYSVSYPGIRPGGSVSNTVTPPLMVQ